MDIHGIIFTLKSSKLRIIGSADGLEFFREAMNDECRQLVRPDLYFLAISYTTLKNTSQSIKNNDSKDTELERIDISFLIVLPQTTLVEVDEID